MKIVIPSQSVEVDPEAWATEYGIDRKDVRDDVIEYFSGFFQEQVVVLGLEEKK